MALAQLLLAKLTTRGRKLTRARKLLDQYRALKIFGRAYDSTVRAELDRMSQGIELLNNRSLDEICSAFEIDIGDFTKLLRPRKPLEFYADFVLDSEIAPDRLLFVAKWQLKAFFAGIEDALRGLDLHPEHTLVSFDVHGLYPPGTRGEVRILEAALFEDMCALFNRATDLSAEAARLGAYKPTIKECAAARRAAILAAFYVIEAYLNSIAFDHLVVHGKSLSQNDLDLITEWDHKRNRQRLVSFRDKLLAYPRIVTGAQHPPLQENNCPELKFLLEESRSFRDAIVHANPRPDAFAFTSTEELLFWRVGSVTPVSSGRGGNRSSGDDAGELFLKTIDSTILVLKQLKQAIHGHRRRLFWLQHRNPAGYFDKSVFD